MAVDFSDPTTWDGDLTDEQAISLGIFAVNTLLYPDASSNAQFSALEFFGEGAVSKLAALRDRLQEAKDE